MIFTRSAKGQDLLVFLFLAFLCFVNFANNLRGEFLVDDYYLVIGDDLAVPANFTGVLKQFVPDYKTTESLATEGRAVYYRPFCHASSFLLSLIFARDPFGYHVSNLVLFSLACFLLFKLFARISGREFFALMVAVLFCLHPLNGMIVNYITATVFALQLIFLSFCLLAYLRGEEKSPLQRGYYIILSLIAFAGALLCHETAITLPAYVFLIAYSRRSSLKAGLKYSWPYFLAAGMYLVFRMIYVPLQHGLLAKTTAFEGLNIGTYLATFMKLLVWYGQKFLTLQGIVLIWSTPLVKVHVWAWMLGATAAVMGLIFLIKKWKGDLKHFYLCWFLIGLPPVAVGCMFIPATGFMIEPHWLFFPSLGLFALAATGMTALGQKLNATFRKVGFISICLILMSASWQNNARWSNELAFARHWVAMAPTNKNALFCLGHALLERGQYTEAKQCFLNSLMGGRADWQNFCNLAQIAMIEKDDTAALEYYKKALEISPNSAAIYNNLGLYFLKKNDLPEAENYLRTAVTFNPYQIESLLNLGNIQEQKNELKAAEYFYLHAYELRPRDERVIFALLRMSLQGKGLPDFSRKTGDFLPVISNEDYLIAIGGLLAVKSRISESLDYFMRAMTLYPKSGKAYSEAGKVLANSGLYSQARKIWNEGLKTDPGNENLKNLLEELEKIEIKKRP